MTFKALVTTKSGDALSSSVTDFELANLNAGDVTVSVEWSTVNYKDELALSGAPIMRSFPLIGGIDFAGVVEASDSSAYKVGDKISPKRIKASGADLQYADACRTIPSGRPMRSS